MSRVGITTVSQTNGPSETAPRTRQVLKGTATRSSLYACLCPHVLSHKATSPIGRGPTLEASVAVITPVKTLVQTPSPEEVLGKGAGTDKCRGTRSGRTLSTLFHATDEGYGGRQAVTSDAPAPRTL